MTYTKTQSTPKTSPIPHTNMYPSKTLSSIILLFFLFFSSDSLQDEQQTPFIPRLLNWVKIKTLFTYLFPPNLDFRGRITNDESETEGGAGDKVKEAVAMSLGKGKATVEESAKSAADLAKEKMQQTAQKLKDTFSSHHQSNEL